MNRYFIIMQKKNVQLFVKNRGTFVKTKNIWKDSQESS